METHKYAFFSLVSTSFSEKSINIIFFVQDIHKFKRNIEQPRTEFNLEIRVIRQRIIEFLFNKDLTVADNLSFIFYR